MSNPLFQQFGKQSRGNDIFSKFNEFRSNFQGDPKAKVQELLNSGQMSQEQFNTLSQMARAFMQK